MTAAYCQMWETPVGFVTDWFSAGAESMLERRGVSRLAIRKGASLIAGFGAAGCTIAFTYCRKPFTAAVANCLAGAFYVRLTLSTYPRFVLSLA